MKYRILIGYIVLVGMTGLPAATRAQGSPFAGNGDPRVLSLAGIWKFKLDVFYKGIQSNGVQLVPGLPEEITLPGSTDQGGKGYPAHEMSSLRLARPFEYKGAAWYEKEVFIPAEWKDRDIQLFLERVHWQSGLWVNGKPAGECERLATPHIYDISSLVVPGRKNRIRLRIDNSLLYDLGYTHMLSAETQTNWNGIIGKIELRAFDRVSLQSIQVYPQVREKAARVALTIANHTGGMVEGSLIFSGKTGNSGPVETIPEKQVSFSGSDSLVRIDLPVPLGDTILLWDEFHPALYKMTIRLKAAGKEGETYSDERQVVFGMRQLSVQGTRLAVNGRPVFIRSTVNSAAFPITGYPPTDTASWSKIFRVARAYGLNAMRFHSWCPPEAAFEVADRLGFYLQVENADWRFTVGRDPATNRFLTEEADRLLDTYGNHPSFTMLCEGNELVGPTVKTFLNDLIRHWKQKDPRHWYTGSSGYPTVTEDEYVDYYGPRPQHWKEGLKGRFNVAPLNTLYDYSKDVNRFKIPMITHEVGQWCVYPDFGQIQKYTGVLRPYNYELFRELLRNHHMGQLAHLFTLASGKFQVIQKKEEIESYLRTPGMAGYTLLQLNDYPGQGTSPVGVVDDFWDPKFYVTAGEFSRFQAACVPLLRTSGFTWTNDETFTAVVQFANFGPSPIRDAVAEWTLRYPGGEVCASGETPEKTIPVGSPVFLDSLSIPLQEIDTAVQLTLSACLRGTGYHNDWHVWVYPKTLPGVPDHGFLLAYAWNKKVKRYLEKGGNVLLLADTAKIVSGADPVFSGISWNTVWSGMPPNLLGILCDPNHPAFSHFPTAFYSDWQWWDLCRHARPMVLDSMPASFLPLVQMIPDWNNPRKLGLLLEAKVGRGRLLLSSIDLRDDLDRRPVARQFLYSLERYMDSGNFNPVDSLPVESIGRIFGEEGPSKK